MHVDFLSRFAALHRQVKEGKLSNADRSLYEKLRREFCRLMVVAQNASTAGRTLRASLRVAQMLKADIGRPDSQVERTSTIDLADGGFAVLLGEPLEIGETVAFTLFTGPKADARAIRGSARVASSRIHGASFRVSFAFVELAADDRAALEILIIDSVLARFGGLF